MSDGFIRVWLGAWTPEKRDALIAALAAAGISLAEPTSGELRVFDPEADLDHLGIPDVVDRPELMRRLALADATEVSVKLWFGPPGRDLFAWFQRLSGAPAEVAVEFSLDGVSPEHADRLMRAIAALPDVKAVVVDRRGVSQDEDWDPVVLGEREPAFPDLLARPGG